MASLTSCQFESVLVNHVSYSPVLLLNISITGVHSVSSLQQLAARQDSLFLLSYTPFHVTQFTSQEDILVRHLATPVQLTLQVARPVVDTLATTGLATLYLSIPVHLPVQVARPLVDSLATSGREEEALLYLGLGAGLAFVGSGGTLVTLHTVQQRLCLTL